MERDYKLFEPIEMWHVAHLSTFLSQLESSGARTATIRINSPGGSWMAGQLMRVQLLSSKLKVTTVNEGLVGSAATLLYAAGNVRQCQPHAKFMMHQVSSEPGYVQVKELKKAVAAQEALNRSTAEMYVVASNKTVEEWEQLMEAETWLSAEQAHTMEFCTEVLPAKPGLVAADASMAAADVHKYYMSLIPPTNEMKLDEVKNALAQAGVTLAADAIDADVLAAIAKLKNQAPTPEAPAPKSEDDNNELAKLRKKIQDLEESRQSDQQKQIENVVNSAISTGKITATQKDTYTSLLKADFTNTTKALDSMPGRTSTAQRANSQAASGAANTARNDWDFDKWSKEDERGLREMKRNDPDQYQNLLTSSGII
ncbi:ATP-dependent Clp protease proteolytic subunit [Hymenobacter sp. BT635]|uniref:ATP-dependent Clp protease proteolytic subunit n=1 Tax=Hymenobacter nitidus TaxID=2880929 RepID=A0ABS8AII4_9BACT|nr:ATP-dependent Clp protease proteolytic subunit [Hymenobacter nitidus]MCB2379807.1 ATP-dependent Clp protease proteolytic subunit [Hymenobacter nitidus]